MYTLTLYHVYCRTVIDNIMNTLLQKTTSVALNLKLQNIIPYDIASTLKYLIYQSNNRLHECYKSSTNTTCYHFLLKFPWVYIYCGITDFKLMKISNTATKCENCLTFRRLSECIPQENVSEPYFDYNNPWMGLPNLYYA